MRGEIVALWLRECQNKQKGVKNSSEDVYRFCGLKLNMELPCGVMRQL